MNKEKNLPFLPGDEVEGLGEIREVEELGPGVWCIMCFSRRTRSG